MEPAALTSAGACLQGRKQLMPTRSLLTLIILLLSACGSASTPVLIPAGPTVVTTPGASPAITVSPTQSASSSASTPAPQRSTPQSTATTRPPTAVPPAPTGTATATDTPPAPIDSPTPVPTDTPSPSPSPLPAQPAVFSFTIGPTITQRLGDRITFNWQAAGDRAQLCPLQGPSGPVESLCIDVPLAGSRSLRVDESMLNYFGFLLRAFAGTIQTGSYVNVRFGCQGFRDWFFPNPPAGCPGTQPQSTEAAAQWFEHGLMVWTKTPDRFYVFFDEGNPKPVQWGGPVTLKPGASPNNRVGGAPDNRFEPVSGFGMLWRGELREFPSMRQRMGWGLTPEFAYNSALQCDMDVYNCYLQVPDNKVRLFYPDSTARAHFFWQLWP